MATRPSTLRLPLARGPVLAWSLWVIGLVQVCGMLVILYIGRGTAVGAVDAFVAGFLVSIFTNATVGAAVAARRPDHYAGWTLLVMGLSFGFALVLAGYGLLGLSSVPRLPAADLALWFSGWSFVPSIATTGTIFLLRFPNGHLPSRGWQWVIALTVGSGVAFALGTALMPGPLSEEAVTATNPVGLGSQWAPAMEFLSTAGNAGSVLSIVLAAASLAVRYRAADLTERLQIKWIAWIGVAMSAAFTIASLQQGPISEFGFLLGFWLLAALPVAIGVAILRYRLYEIDRLVNRTIVYGALTALLAGLYSASITLSQRVFLAVTGETSDAAIVLTTLVVAWAYTPVRKRLESVVDRYLRFETARFGAYRDELRRTRELLVPEEALQRLLREAVQGVSAPGGMVERRSDEEWVELATIGAGAARHERLELPVWVDGEVVARLALDPRPGRPYAAAEVEALQDLAGLAGQVAGLHASPGRNSSSGAGRARKSPNSARS
jgi:hypothetical protein